MSKPNLAYKRGDIHTIYIDSSRCRPPSITPLTSLNCLQSVSFSITELHPLAFAKIRPSFIAKASAISTEGIEGIDLHDAAMNCP
jgi:hypothetical protein